MTATDQPTTAPEQVPVAVAWARCLADIGAIGKQRSPGVDYAFRSIDTLMNVAHPVFARHGVAVIPQGGRIQYEQLDRTSRAGSASRSSYVWLEAGFLIIGPMGDTIEGGGFGEGTDTSDKATNKANSAAFKYFLMQALCIPLADIEDSDRTPNRRNQREDGDGDDGAPRTSSARPRTTTTRPAQARRAKPAEPDPKDNAEAELPVAQQRLLARVRGLPAKHQAAIAAYMKAEQLSLLKPLEADAIKTVTAYVDAMPDSLD